MKWEITLSTGNVTLVASDNSVTQAVYASVYDANGVLIPNPSVNFSSSDTNVATVSGKVYQGVYGQVYTYVTAGNTPGTATITATDGGASQGTTVSVGTNAAKVTITGNNSVSVGASETLTAQLWDAKGKSMMAPSGVNPTWSLTGSNAADATISSSGVFFASQAGNYTVNVNYDGVTSSAKVAVYGQPAALKLSAASASLIANGSSTDTVTATIVDANGNTVANYNGSGTLGGLTNGTATGAYGATLTNGSTIDFANGVATFNLSAASSAATKSDTLSLSGLTNVPAGFVYNTLQVSYEAATASAIGLSAPSKVSVNSTGNYNVDVTINDSTGNPLTTGNAVYVTFTVSGPATFDANGQTTYSEYISPTAAGIPVKIDTKQGQTGTIAVTATAVGYSSASASTDGVITTSPTNITVTQSSGTVTASNQGTSTLPLGTSYTEYSVQLVDANGNPVTTTSENLTISDTTGTTGGTLVYYPISSSGTLGASTAVGSLGTGFTGAYNFAVINTQVGSSNPTISVKDPLTGVTQTVGYSFKTGSAAYAVLTGDAMTTNTTQNQAAMNAQAGQTVTFTAQVQDANGNNLAQSGQSVNFYFGSNAGLATINGSSNWTSANPYVVTTNAQGQASVTVTLPSGATSGYKLDAAVGTGTATSDTVTYQAAGNYATSLQVASVAPGNVLSSSDLVTLPTTMTSGSQLFSTSTYAILENVIGQEVYSGAAASLANADTIQISTSNPSVLSIAGANSSGVATLASNIDALPVVTASQDGTATLTIQDISNPSAPKVTTTITVSTGSPAQLNVLNPSGQANTAYTFASSGVSGPFTIQVTDAGGNLTPESAPLTLTTSQIEAAIGVAGIVGIRTSSTGSDVSSVTVGQNQTSVQVWLDGVTQNNSTTPPASTVLQLSHQTPSVTSASVNGDVVTLTFDNPIQGTPVLADITDSTGTPLVAQQVQVNGDTVVITFAAAPTSPIQFNTGNGLTTGYGAQLPTTVTF